VSWGEGKERGETVSVGLVVTAAGMPEIKDTPRH